MQTVTAPEGNHITYTRDGRGNVVQTDYVAKSGSGLSTMTAHAAYPASCSNMKTCNQPTSTTDVRGKVTTYTYDSNHGGVTSVTQPAVDGVSPQTRYTYSAHQAYYKNAAGSVVASGVPVYRLDSTSACQTGAAATPGGHAACEGHADEVRTAITYGAMYGTSATNLLPTRVAAGSGDGVLTATTTTTYDAVGNVLTVDGPLSGTADTIRYRYDADREVVGATAPDPDGSGAVKMAAQRLTYNDDGQVTLAETGSVASQSDADWADFTSVQKVASHYDTAGRKDKDSVQAGSTTYSVTQYSYDAAGRADCTALRMTPSAYGSLPASACTLAAADRIGKTLYDAADRPVKAQSYDGSALATVGQTGCICPPCATDPRHVGEDGRHCPTPSWSPTFVRSSPSCRPTVTVACMPCCAGKPRRPGAQRPPKARLPRHEVHGLLLRRDGEQREEPRHDVRVAVDRRNTRWCSDGLEIACDNGEKVRVAFALDCCDREAMGHVATTGGITAEDVQDPMGATVEHRFGFVNR